jgi:hypothetical protein
LQKELTGDLLFDLEALKEFQNLSLSELDTIDDSAGVHSLSEVTFGLAHKFTDEEHIGCGSITSDVVLSGGRTANHSGSRVLDLHLMEKHSTVLGKLDLSGTSNQPIKIQTRN